MNILASIIIGISTLVNPPPVTTVTTLGGQVTEAQWAACMTETGDHLHCTLSAKLF